MTTLTTVLGVVWPGERVVVEADCSGADLPFRLRHADGDRLLDPQPSVLALAADARGVLPSGGLVRYAQPTVLGVPVIPGALSAESYGPMARLWPRVADAAAGWSGTALADLGRLQPGDAAVSVAQASTVVLLLARADVAGLYRLRERVLELAGTVGDPARDSSPLAVVVRARSGNEGRAAGGAVRQLLEACGSPIPVLGVFAEDSAGAAGLMAGELTRRVAGSELVRSGRALAQKVLTWWPQLATSGPPVDAEPRLGASAGSRVGA